MYDVSEEYLAQIHNDVTQSYVTFTIDNVQYTEDNILQGSFNISNQCTGTNDVTIGAVYVGVLNAVLRGVNITRQTWRGKQIIPTFHFLVDEENDTWETVPLGIFTISQAEWKATGITIKAYDNMSLLDKAFSINQASGTLYDFLSLAAVACDITLGQTREEFATLPNGTMTFSFYSGGGVETWRDLVSYIAQVCGGFATVDRSGQLVIRTYGTTAIAEINPSQRHTGVVFSDFKTKYTSISITFIDAKETKIYTAAVNDGLMMVIGANPFLQNENQARVAAPNIVTAIGNIQYNPYKASIASNPIFDLGDVIEFVNGIAGTSSMGCVQKYEFYLHKNMKLSGYGADPNSAEARSKTQKQIAQVASAVNNSAQGSYEVRNITDFEIENGHRRRVLNIKFVSTVASRIQIHINVNLETLADTGYDATKVKATFTVNNDDDDTLYPQETYIDGKHVMHLMYIMPILQDSIAYFHLTLESVDGSITIGTGGIWAYAEGAGLIGDGKWSGTFDIFEDVVEFAISDTITVNVASENITIGVQVPVGATLSDTVTELSISEITLVDVLTDRVRIVNYEDETPRCTENDDVRVTEDGDLRYTEKEHS